MNSVKLVFVNVFCLFEKFDENSIREFEKIGNLKSSLSENIKILRKRPFTSSVIVLSFT
ncbi:hypothetical protein RV13_GL001853 [Enterococcus raffinosus]|nr:hypothetical protein RV13_GL001853 [Enterococcus raffinosus]